MRNMFIEINLPYTFKHSILSWCIMVVKKSHKAFRTWWSRRCPHGSWHLPQQKPKVWCKEPKSQNIYPSLLIKLYRFLARQTNPTFNQMVLKRLFMSPPTGHLGPFPEWCRRGSFPARGQNHCGYYFFVVVIGTITDDIRVQEVPNLKVVCTSCEQPSPEPHPQG